MHQFKLREHDYVFGDKKVQQSRRNNTTYYTLLTRVISPRLTQFGGNAQSITKDRWVHHTSFLWDFDPANMDYLTVSGACGY